MRATANSPPAQGLYDPAHEHDACGVGFVAHIKGRRSHTIVQQALQVLINLQHRGACGCEANTGDGAGILIQMPDRFLRKEAGRLGLRRCRPRAATARGWSSCRTHAERRAAIERLFERIVAEEGQRVLGWRDVPTDNSALGPSAVAVEPVFRQIFIGRGPATGCAGGPGRAGRGVRAQAVRHPQAHRARGRRARRHSGGRGSSSTWSACRRAR